MSPDAAFVAFRQLAVLGWKEAMRKPDVYCVAVIAADTTSPTALQHLLWINPFREYVDASSRVIAALRADSLNAVPWSSCKVGPYRPDSVDRGPIGYQVEHRKTQQVGIILWSQQPLEFRGDTAIARGGYYENELSAASWECRLVRIQHGRRVDACRLGGCMAMPFTEPD